MLFDFYDDMNLYTGDDPCDGMDRISLTDIWNSVKGNSWQSIISVSDFLTYLFEHNANYPNSAIASVMRNFEIYDIVVPDGDIMTFPGTFDFLDKVAILVEDGGNLNILEDTSTIFNEDYNQIVVEGGFNTNINTSFINIGDQYLSEFVFSSSDDLCLDFVSFNNCKLDIMDTKLNVNNSTFQQSCIDAFKGGSRNIEFNECSFSGFSDYYPAINIDFYDNVEIRKCNFEETFKTIALHDVGLKGDCIITKNTFFNTTSYSIYSYHSNTKILNNEISFGDWAIYGSRNSKISMSGPDSSDPNQNIHDNDRSELVFTQDSFPARIHHNIISHDNSNSNTLITVIGGEDMRYNVKENYWGENFDPETDFEPYELFDYLPIWYPVRGDSLSRETVQELYNTAEEAIEEGNYSYAKAIFQSIIEDYPENILALASAKSLLHVESLSEENYLGIQNYLNTITNSNFPLDLVNCCDYLSNNCDLLMENYPQALAWFEDKIENPISFADSIYALIDLNHTYFLLDQNQRETLIKSELCFDPFTRGNFLNTKNELIDRVINGNSSNDIPTIENVVLHQNFPNPFNPETNISFSIPEESKINLTIYNIKGQKVKSLVNEILEKGIHSIIWSGKDQSEKQIASGVYFYKLKVNGKTESVKKCLLLK